jgi:hypothetical protein
MAESARKNPGSFGFTDISTPCRDFIRVWQKEPCVRYNSARQVGEKLETVRAPLVEDAVLMVLAHRVCVAAYISSTEERV